MCTRFCQVLTLPRLPVSLSYSDILFYWHASEWLILVWRCTQICDHMCNVVFSTRHDATVGFSCKNTQKQTSKLDMLVPVLVEVAKWSNEVTCFGTVHGAVYNFVLFFVMYCCTIKWIWSAETDLKCIILTNLVLVVFLPRVGWDHLFCNSEACCKTILQ